MNLHGKVYEIELKRKHSSSTKIERVTRALRVDRSQLALTKERCSTQITHPEKLRKTERCSKTLLTSNRTRSKVVRL